MTPRPRLLVVAPRFPYPVVGGDRLRLVRMCEQFAGTFELTLVALCESEVELEVPVPANAPFKHVRRVLLPRWQSRLQVLRAVLSRRPLQVAYFSSPRLQAIVDEEVATHDAVLAHLIRSAAYLERHESLVRVVELTDAISLNYSRVVVGGGRNALRRLVYFIERPRLLRAELRALEQFDLCTLVSPVDRDFLVAQGGNASRVAVGTNGVRLDWPAASFREPRFVAFIGNMTTIQNLDAARFYAEQVHPAVFGELGLRFRVIGRIAPGEAQSLARIPGVDVTGEVRDVGDHAVGAVAGICSVRIGAGVQNKILEYMAMRVPVISSSVGLEGLSAMPGRDLLIANSPQEWRAALGLLVKDGAFATRMADSGRRYVEAEHDWRRSLAPIVSRVTELVAARRAGAPQR